ncbi:MAG: hypothetical protein AB7R89_11640 [Dehalococcoidia bacterium]
MADNTFEQTQLSIAADEVGRRVAASPQAAGEITPDHVQMLLEAGIPGATIAELLRAEGVEEAEVAGYAFDGGLVPAPNIKIGTICVGTCSRYTIVIGCEISLRAEAGA